MRKYKNREILMMSIILNSELCDELLNTIDLVKYAIDKILTDKDIQDLKELDDIKMTEYNARLKNIKDKYNMNKYKIT